jgi:hypothetical protein
MSWLTGLRSFPSHRKVRLMAQQGPAALPCLRLCVAYDFAMPAAREHRLLRVRLRRPLLILQKSQRLEPVVLLLQPGLPFGFPGLHPPVLLTPAVVGRLSHLDESAELCAGLALPDLAARPSTAKQKPLGLELADDLLRWVLGEFHGPVPGPVWPAEDSHSS